MCCVSARRDVQALHGHFKAHGIPIVIDPFDTPVRADLLFRDPDGNAIAIHGGS